MASGARLRGPAGHFAGITFDYRNIDPSRWPYRLPGPADTQLGSEMEHLERVLAAHALSVGVEIRRGHGVEGFEPSDRDFGQIRWPRIRSIEPLPRGGRRLDGEAQPAVAAL